MGLFRKFMGSSDTQAGPADATPQSRTGQEDRRDRGEKPKPAAEDEYAPPAGPPPSYQAGKRNPSGGDYPPPPGYPPSRRNDDSTVDEEYLPPPGPPPTHMKQKQPAAMVDFEPPPGPPPGRDDAPPSYHDWQTAVPDTALLPPPPVAANDYSSTSNADSSDASRARDWCRTNPLRPAGRPSPQQTLASETGAVKLMSPGSRTHASLQELAEGSWSGATTAKATDLCFSTNLPLYYPFATNSPKMTGQPVAAYFEVHLNRIGNADFQGNLPSLAIGFVAAPYPTWRMPGWERGSLAVHSDDGCRYINNQDGGLDFVEPFRSGDVVGLGVRFWNEGWGGGANNNLRGEAFFTRNGQMEGTWSLQEETDAEDVLGNLGIEGDHDLFGAIGTYGEISFKVVFKPEAWMFKPKHGLIPGL